ncbi:MAG: EMC3/TMCO1 family protein [Candidatus Parvarchaeota archaeon]|nr:EMC3/TMCO1 family protein [Candidatus Parvarchaeota archaeon]MCW1294249.1 EMC3/TMCO1 family protein [Candidatus Parvarchaeum tengchongense]MCW1295074.1 EMC3/TMCO1 family protein [Candidatus Parvarchaeum tengchongense]
MNIDVIAVILISIAVGASGQIAYLFIVDHEMVRTSKARIKELQQKMKGMKPDHPEFKPTYSELMAENSKIMKQSMKPTFITFVPFLIVFLLMSSYFSYVPVAIGSPIAATFSGNINGTLFSANNCITFNGHNNVSIFSNDTSLKMTANITKSGTCTLFLSTNGKVYNNSFSLVGKSKVQTINLNSSKVEFIPDTFIITKLPFSLPLIGNELNWYWAYLIITFITSITLNRILIHFKLIA